MHKQHVLILNVFPVDVRLKFYISKMICEFILVPGLPANDGNTGLTNMYLMLALWLAIAFLLFIFRPRTLRNNREQPGKSNNQV